MPDADGLSRDLKLAGNLDLADAGGEQLGRAEPAGLEPVAFSLRRRAARDCEHPRILARPAASLQLGRHPQPDTKPPFRMSRTPQHSA
jgi:hypothetical protein